MEGFLIQAFIYLVAAVIAGGAYLLYSGQTPQQALNEAAEAVNAPEALESASDAVGDAVEATQEAVDEVVDSATDTAEAAAEEVSEAAEAPAGLQREVDAPRGEGRRQRVRPEVRRRPLRNEAGDEPSGDVEAPEPAAAGISEPQVAVRTDRRAREARAEQRRRDRAPVEVHDRLVAPREAGRHRAEVRATGDRRAARAGEPDRRGELDHAGVRVDHEALDGELTIRVDHREVERAVARGLDRCERRPCARDDGERERPAR